MLLSQPAMPDEAVEALGVHDGLDRIAADLAADQRRAHALVAHRDAVGDSDRAELHGEAAGVTHALLHVLGEGAQGHVARRQLVPRVGDADLRLVPVVVGHADGTQHRSRRCSLHAVGDIARPRLDVDAGAVVRVGHPADSSPPYWWDTRANRRIESVENTIVIPTAQAIDSQTVLPGSVPL